MLKDVISYFDYSWFEEVAIVLFGLTFVAIVIGSLWLKKEAVDKFSRIPLTDDVVDPRSEAQK